MTKQSAKQPLGRVVKRTQMPDLNKQFTTEQLAKAITAKRTGLKLTLLNVSEALAISKPTLIKIEKGDPKVKFVNILKVMEYLGLSFSLVTDELTEQGSTVGEDDVDWF